MLHRVPLNLKAYFCCVAIKKRSPERTPRRSNTAANSISSSNSIHNGLHLRTGSYICCYVVFCPNYKTNNNINSRKNARVFVFYFTNNPASAKVYNKLRYIANTTTGIYATTQPQPIVKYPVKYRLIQSGNKIQLIVVGIYTLPIMSE